MILVVTHFSIDLKLFLVNAVNKICDVFDTPTKYAINLHFTKPIFPGGILFIFIYISDIMINNSQKKVSALYPDPDASYTMFHLRNNGSLPICIL